MDELKLRNMVKRIGDLETQLASLNAELKALVDTSISSDQARHDTLSRLDFTRSVMLTPEEFKAWRIREYREEIGSDEKADRQTELRKELYELDGDFDNPGSIHDAKIALADYVIAALRGGD